MMNEDSNEMELFQYDSRARRRILNSESTSNSSLRQTLTANDEMTCHFNLIYFCGAVQALGLDFLPVYWQPRSGLIGSGGTSKIHQSLLALDLSLAFKAIALGDVARNRTTQDLKSMYLFLLAEIQHMGRKPILDSPYIHRVEGICWNLNVRTGAADPVLVYKKVKHGDMHRFMTSGQGSSLDFRERIEMCRDVAMGLMTLHACSLFFIALQCNSGSHYQTRYHTWGYQTSKFVGGSRRWIRCSTNRRLRILHGIYELGPKCSRGPHNTVACPRSRQTNAWIYPYGCNSDRYILFWNVESVGPFPCRGCNTIRNYSGLR